MPFALRIARSRGIFHTHQWTGKCKVRESHPLSMLSLLLDIANPESPKQSFYYGLVHMAPRTVLITGCSDDGIGYGLALTFQRQGYQVFATTRNLDKVTKLNDLSNFTLLQIKCDGAKPD